MVDNDQRLITMVQGGGWGESLLASYIGPHLPILSLSILDSPFSRLFKLFAAASSNCAQGCRPELPAANRPCPSSQAPTQTLRQPISLSPRVPWRGDGPALPAGSPGSAQPGPCTGGVLGLAPASRPARHQSRPAGWSLLLFFACLHFSCLSPPFIT